MAACRSPTPKGQGFDPCFPAFFPVNKESRTGFREGLPKVMGPRSPSIEIMLLTRSKTFLSLQRSSSPWGVSPSSQASRRSKRSFQGSRGKTTPSRWRYQTRVPRNIDRYVSQFYGYTQVIFKRKVYYRKLQKKALAVR